MKKILLISDTHGYIDDRIIQYAKESDETWHAGDIGELKVVDELKKVTTLRAVHGNIDNSKIRAEYAENLRFKIEDMKIWITHIGGYPNKYNQRIRQEIYNDPPDIFICGHSHILKVINDNKLNLLHINPGAIGKHGFHHVRTMIRFEIIKSKIQNLEVIEFKR
ncbi:metallophosphatase family protein [Flavobacteriaceae bacterium]|jgi:putative phosphoesterase|nr:metallophosphoesterase family protein [Flavobacteriaceae bacterium]MDB2350338.1 metallophosphatase family protein [Flavobacteriaceae bacterium]MDC0478315.1 metallophosphatase family protein [Flavobacteriaceae bacterium]MDC1372353.1 metallophosphatase family protein [Flavobacteriaceae bacterium]